MAIKIEPLDAPMGAVVHGLDSRRALSDEDFNAVEQAMLDPNFDPMTDLTQISDLGLQLLGLFLLLPQLLFTRLQLLLTPA